MASAFSRRPGILCTHSRLERGGQMRGNIVMTNESVSNCCQIQELSTFLQDLDNQADINCKVITVSVIGMYFNCACCTILCISSIRNIYLCFLYMGMLPGFRNRSLCRNTQCTLKKKGCSLYHPGFPSYIPPHSEKTPGSVEAGYFPSKRKLSYAALNCIFP